MGLLRDGMYSGEAGCLFRGSNFKRVVDYYVVLRREYGCCLRVLGEF